MSCQYQEWHEGNRTFSHHLPPSCWGAYMPGDKPGLYCDNGEPCQDPDGDYPCDCYLQEDTDYICPNGCERTLIETGHCYYCPDCNERFTQDEVKDLEIAKSA